MTEQMQPNKAKPCVGQGRHSSRVSPHPRCRLLPPCHPFSENSSKQEARGCQGRTCWTELLADRPWGMQSPMLRIPHCVTQFSPMSWAYLSDMAVLKSSMSRRSC